MKIAIMQPYFFPSIGYWQLMNAVEKYIVYDTGHLIKNGWIHKNKILINGAAHNILLHIHNKSSNQRICESQIIYDENFIRKQIDTIFYAYKRAYYFNDVMPIIEEILRNREIFLSDYLYNSILKIRNYIGINNEIIKYSDLGMEMSFEYSAKEKIKLVSDYLRQKEEYIEYYNAVGGMKFFTKEEFEECGIKLLFLKADKIKYFQNSKNNVFIPEMSIIDVMMNNSKEEIGILLKQYQLL